MTGKTSMQKSFRLCLWQVVLCIFTVSVFSISMLYTSNTAFSQEVQTQERSIHMRSPNSTDAFPFDRYGPITQRDTLWNIALTVSPDGRLSVYQVMEALYQANPNSFVNRNFNHLVEGQYLTIPSFDQMMSVNKAMAKQKSIQDDIDWHKKQGEKIAKKAEPREYLNVNKIHLDTVKIEINDQLKEIDHEKEKRLTNIQHDVLKSIDGLQAILKENEELRQKLTSFNNQLISMKTEVAKGKEIKLQVDDLIRLQQVLLDKYQANEQELLLEREQAVLEKDNVYSNVGLIVLIVTLPAVLILLVVALIFKRRNKDTITSVNKSKKISKIKAENISKEPKADIDVIGEFSLDDDLEEAKIEQGELDSLLMADDAIEKQEAQENEALGDEQSDFFDDNAKAVKTNPDDLGIDSLIAEESLAELLNDQAADHTVELTPNVSEQNILADLLNENNDKSQVSEATEINDIQELDSLDFDELLANIEEESSSANQSVDFNRSLEVDDDVSLADFGNSTSNIPLNDSIKATKNDQSFVSVDSLLSETQYEASDNEPYDKTNIDVGLNEFPEFTDGVNKIDVDVDKNGMSAKLGLAKIYIEIGDHDNAQVILQEVVKLGDTQQQIAAKKLLDNL